MGDRSLAFFMAVGFGASKCVRLAFDVQSPVAMVVPCLTMISSAKMPKSSPKALGLRLK